MLKKFLLFTLSFLILMTSHGFCGNKNVGEIGEITSSPIRTYINGQPIQSWVIDDKIYVDVQRLEKYGYDVLKVDGTNTYIADFDNHTKKEETLRKLKTQQISSNDIKEMWYGDWIESIDPRTDSFYYRTGDYVYDYSYAENAATITFSRDIPIEEINTHNIRVYGDGFDLTDYFSYDYFEKVNRLTITPIDDVVFKHVDDHRPFFTVVINGTLKDAQGQSLINPISHGFYMDHRWIQTGHTDGQPTPYLIENKSDYIFGDTVLTNAEFLGYAKWNEEKKHLEIQGELDTPFSGALREISKDTYPNIISNVLVADRQDQKEKGFGIIKSSDRQQLGLLVAPLADGYEIKQFVKLRFGHGHTEYVPILDGNIIKVPEGTPSSFYKLVLMEGLTLENGAVLEESIYFSIYIGEE